MQNKKPTLEEILRAPVDRIKGISTKRSALLAKLDIYTIYDMATHFPRRYEDWTAIKNLLELGTEDNAIFLARIETVPNLFRKGRRSILNVTARDDTAVIRLVWFNQPYYQKQLEKGKIYLFRGKVERKGLKFEAINPKFRKTNLKSFPQSEEEWEAVVKSTFVEPIYPATSGISQNNLRKWTKTALNMVLPYQDEFLSPEIRQEYKLADLIWSLKEIHKPEQLANYEIARKRLAFDELLLMQLALEMDKSAAETKKGIPLDVYNKEAAKGIQNAIASLDFSLTNDQKSALEDILLDMKNADKAMNRLLQGDVGSGKTIVAFLAMLWTYFHDYQAVLMAPTAILAKQHYENFIKFFPELAKKSNLTLLTSQNTDKEKAEIYQGLKSGEIKLIIGTHALINQEVQFKNLALAVTDEQHRFGVKQRMQLSEESPAHVLVMSATPIPRTLGLLLYGDLAVSVLREKPKGRAKTLTYTARSKDKGRLLNLMRRNKQRGGQSYVVCPLVEDNKENDLASVEIVSKKLASLLKDLTVKPLHGQMKDSLKNETMEAFLEHKVDVLVSTTVIEVGVDNPKASFMLVLNAERFGLAELHQLRGRIGRGSLASLCVLHSDTDDEKSRARLNTMCKTDDGFEIAEADLKLRGPGDFFGTRQHGIPNFKVANLYEDGDLIRASANLSKKILNEDPNLSQPQHQNLKRAVNIFRQRSM